MRSAQGGSDYKPQHRFGMVYSQLRGGSQATQPQSEHFPVHGPCTGLFTSVLECFSMAFSASPGLCHQLFPCLTEYWTELESEN